VRAHAVREVHPFGGRNPKPLVVPPDRTILRSRSNHSVVRLERPSLDRRRRRWLFARVWDAGTREPALRPLVEQWYRRDDTVTPPVYRLRRETGHPLRDDEATALVQYWEVQGLPGAGDSLTAHEIFRGVLEAAEPRAHALCYVRTPGLADDPSFPSSFVPVFVETDEAVARRWPSCGRASAVPSPTDCPRLRSRLCGPDNRRFLAAGVPVADRPLGAGRRRRDPGGIAGLC
jgi:hypothetical protein